MGKAVRLPTASLFENRDVSLDGFIPAFTKKQIEDVLHIKESYTVGDFDSETKNSITLPNGTVLTVVVDYNSLPKDGMDIINNFIRKYQHTNQNTAIIQWVRENSIKLNSSRFYWEAINLRELAEITLLKANVHAAQAQAFLATGKPLNSAEINRLVTELGYDPDLSWGYK